jgi:PAS domain S-box-containing protein
LVGFTLKFNMLPPFLRRLFASQEKTFTRRRDWGTLRWYTAAPLVGLLAFALLMAALFAYVHSTEREQRKQALYRDMESAQQIWRVKLRDHLDTLSLHAADLALPGSSEDTRKGTIKDFLLANPVVSYVAWLDRERQVRSLMVNSGVARPANRSMGQRVEESASFGAFTDASESRKATYSEPFLAVDNDMLVELHVPIIWQGRFEGTLVTAYSLARGIQKLLPEPMLANYKLDLIDHGGNSLVSTSQRKLHDINMSYEVPLDPPGRGIRLRGYVFEVPNSLIDRLLVVTVSGLSIAIAASLLALWRFAGQRAAAEQERDRLFALSADVLCILDANGKFTRVNPAFHHLFGQRAGDLSLIQTAHPEDAIYVSEKIALALAPLQDAAVRLEMRCQDHRGAYRWLAWSMRGERRTPNDLNSRLIYAVAHDITERKQAEQSLASESAFRRSMEDSMLTGMRAFDRQGNITYVNRAFCQMMGLSEQELLGKGAPFAYWPAEAHAEHAKNLALLLAGRVPPSGLETQVIRGDGTILDARMYVSPLIDAAGVHSGWMTSMTDITEPKRVRQELADAQERLTAVLDQFEAAVCVFHSQNQATKLLLTNRTHRALFGDSVLPWPEFLLTSLQESDPNEVQLPECTSWYELRTRSIRWVDGQQVTLLVATDVSQRRANRELQRQQEEKLQQTSRLITMGEMASSLAHELNQPLTAISNYTMGSTARVLALKNHTQAAEAQIIAQELLDAMNKTARQAERAGQVIRRIRDFVKRSDPQRSTCHAAELVGDAIGLAEIDARRHGVAIHCEMTAALPSVQADKILVEQVLLNLIKNGIESMLDTKDKNLFVSAQQTGDHLEFCVADRGSGMSPAGTARLFEPFYTTKRDGMGMGLSICRSIVESHQGRLWVEAPSTGAGSQFKFTLPLPLSIAS